MRIIGLNDPHSGLLGVIALDRPDKPPAFGGTRIATYTSLDDCVADARRLARAMTLKCVTHGIPGSGGKAALVASAIVDRQRVLAQLAAQVESLHGAFYTGPDSGLSAADVATLAQHTRFVATGDVSAATARGLLTAIVAAGDHYGISVPTAAIAIQGLGAVGRRLALLLRESGANVSAADTSKEAREWATTHGIALCNASEVLSAPCDILVPCALGGVIDEASARALRCRVVVGAANNVLAADALAETLAGRGIAFIPDFVANAGGVIHGAWSFLRGTPGTDAEIDQIGERVRRLLEVADERNKTPLSVALEAAGVF